MKLFRCALLGIFLLLPMAAFAFAPSSPITVSTSAGGTLVVPQGVKNYYLSVTNTGATNTMDCSIGATPTSTNYTFSLAPLTTQILTSARLEPTNLGVTGSLAPPDAITCLAISGSTTASYEAR